MSNRQFIDEINDRVKDMIPVGNSQRGMRKKSSSHLHKVTMLPFNNPILMMGMWINKTMNDAQRCNILFEGLSKYIDMDSNSNKQHTIEAYMNVFAKNYIVVEGNKQD